jgi:hypothetical protein
MLLLGTNELVTINQLVDLVAELSWKSIEKRHDLSKPQGVRGREQRQHQTSRGSGLGAPDNAEGRVCAYLQVDRVILAAQGDGVLLVLDTQNARKAYVLRSVRRLETVGANVIGTVMNKVRARDDS